MGIGRGFRSTLPRILLVAWFGAMLLVGAGLLARHALALPAPTKSETLVAQLNALRDPGAPASWVSAHVLYSECRCSERIVAHLVSSRRPPGWTEVVLWTGDKPPSRELTDRFHVVRMSSAELSRLSIEGAPLLVVMSPRNEIRYSGGYTERKQGAVIEDLRVFDELRRAGTPLALPVFGCAVSDELKRILANLPSP